MLFELKGIPKIKIPVKLSELISREKEIEVLKKYLNGCMLSHNANMTKIDYLYKFYLGKQDIYDKKRPYIEDSETNIRNNRIVENHAYSQVEFKKSLCGTLQYTHKQGISLNDDLSILGNSLTDVSFAGKHQDIFEFMYATGIGTSFTIPRTDIIEENGKYSNSFNPDTQASFIFECVDPRLNFNIYSSYIGEEPLFSVSIVDKSEKTNTLTVNKYLITIYSRNNFYEIEAGMNLTFTIDENKMIAKDVAYHKLPIIEYSYNKSRIGLIEINLGLFNLINLIKSNSADAMVDTVNNIIVFDGVEIDEDGLNSMLSSGAIKIKAPDMGSPVSSNRRVYTLEVKFNHSDINVFYEQTIDKAYNIVGCVRATSSTNSGGTTKSGSETSNGWDNAWSIIKKDINSIVRCDYEQLKAFIDISSLVPNSKINELSPNQIEIKYGLTPNDNIQAKTQSALYLDKMGMPEEMILQKSGLSMDINAEAEMWRENKKKVAALINTQSVSTSIDGNTAV